MRSRFETDGFLISAGRPQSAPDESAECGQAGTTVPTRDQRFSSARGVGQRTVAPADGVDVPRCPVPIARNKALRLRAARRTRSFQAATGACARPGGCPERSMGLQRRRTVGSRAHHSAGRRFAVGRLGRRSRVDLARAARGRAIFEFAVATGAASQAGRAGASGAQTIALGGGRSAIRIRWRASRLDLRDTDHRRWRGTRRVPFGPHDDVAIDAPASQLARGSGLDDDG
jgi:hypothetical protein